MAFIRPYVTEKFTSYKGDAVTTRLSLAVWLKDDYTKKEPIGRIKVLVKKGDIEAVKNLSGYYIFTDLAPGEYPIGYESDLYFSDETPVNTSLLDPKSPVFEFILKPRPSYPFPAHATLIRGLILKPNKEPVAKADVKAVEANIETESDDNGEFVLYFNDIKNKKITIEIKKGGAPTTIKVNLEEGKTKSLGRIIFS
ncbi:MAG: hypothetical protein OIN66_03740 [Candidatus Methanoperedens sp.]|nr:hypothetical protein [Candidatus Methanoperedens sp.]